MACVVWKYKIPDEDEFTINMPEGAQVLTVQVQPSVRSVVIWALVNPEHRTCQRSFRLAGTGEPIDWRPEALRFIGSVQLHRGLRVLHVFEILTGLGVIR
jgi:hypothetical protein